MRTMLKEMDRRRVPMVSLTVLKENLRARALYESLGFAIKGEAPCHEDKDSYYMEREHGQGAV